MRNYAFKENLNFKSFITSRFFRIYPLHIIMLLIFIAVQIFKLVVYKANILSFNIIAFTRYDALREIIPNLLLLQSWTPFTYALSFNSVAWSISVEFYLYIILFLTLSVFKKFTKVSWILLTIGAFF